MKNLSGIFLLLLFLAPLASIFYKVNIKQVAFIPKASSNIYNVELVYLAKDIFADSEEEKIELPVFHSWHNQELLDQKFYLPAGSEIVHSEQGQSIRVGREVKEDIKVFAKIRLGDSVYGSLMSSPLEGDKDQAIQTYLSLNGLSDKSRAKLRELGEKFNFSQDSHEEIVRKLYFFITEEIITSSEANEIEDVINLAEGSARAKARLMTLMARDNGIPARTNLAFKIEKTLPSGNNFSRAFLPEVLIEDRWRPVSVNALTFSRVPERHFILGKGAEQAGHLFESEQARIRASAVMLNKVNSQEYRKKLASISSFWANISLHNLPVSLQGIFYTVLLIPVGTIILSFGRNIVGLKTFGIFTPILLSLFFLETSILAGAAFFFFIVALGFAQRHLLDKFHLLAVPRLSILLTLVVISFLIAGLLSRSEGSILYGTNAFSYFPIVIIAVFIERFSVNFIEEGAINTLQTLIGTLTVSLACLFALKSEFLKMALFNHPELLFIVIGLNFIIGKYKGYRLSEFIRFKEFREVDA